ncbi:hypothetical protein CIHG_09303 [Coccidioides immitis H538.4]|uniref:Uncharacterized protein n=2 Tax=Coccidioides immitis TaxID=5501 RepID=A0A0J8U294_COCIT|nr:hypothetical protein CISG_08771 [Coccidioides immitis RMSCC 3703]KMU91434.1 hypothetical protein CIHG_09303 [Coccidioides immitis H538.4]
MPFFDLTASQKVTGSLDTPETPEANFDFIEDETIHSSTKSKYLGRINPDMPLWRSDLLGQGGFTMRGVCDRALSGVISQRADGVGLGRNPGPPPIVCGQETSLKAAYYASVSEDVATLSDRTVFTRSVVIHRLPGSLAAIESSMRPEE